jgi:hypothetical protein
MNDSVVRREEAVKLLAVVELQGAFDHKQVPVS